MKAFDKRAQKILLNAYWKSGWLDEQSRGAKSDDIAYAKSKGYWLDDLEVSHDQIVNELIKIRQEITAREVGNAFLASLSSRRLELRSALGSFAFAHRFPDHQIRICESRKVPSGATICEVCGFWEFDKPKTESLNVLNFERYKWGGVRHDDIVFAWFDLSQFRNETPLQPTEEDAEIMRSILMTASSLPNDAHPSMFAKELGGVLKSNIDERRTLIEILSIAGILKPRDRSGYLDEFTIVSKREESGEHFNDWGYPARWWRGGDGIDKSAVRTFFGDI